MADTSAFVAETEPYRRELFAHCYRMLGSVQDAEDLVQETFLRAWRSYAGFEGRSSVRTWLYQIATNCCLSALADHHRRVLPSGLGSAEPNPDQPAEPAPAGTSWLQPVPDNRLLAYATGLSDPAAIVAEREGVRLALIAGLQHLPARQRAVLVLREVLAFPARDVAEMLGTSTASVKSALQRARATLQERSLDAEQIAAPDEPRAKEFLERYITAFENADAAELERLLVADATLEATPLRTWFAGRQTCVPFLQTHVLGTPGTWRMFPVRANGQPAITGYVRDASGVHRPYGVTVLTIREEGISRVTSFGDPDLLAAFGFPAVPPPQRP
ncbi:MAG TPA: sigma-70 family RNA polymerase sigma factor [Frankiaceae bacterium]|jgi:RNA polymerase sigma-70 factor (ECF subfamily)|nr:sigma-70 family RNA polymerase sigma factor [Frankiaceae bacterium]